MILDILHDRLEIRDVPHDNVLLFQLSHWGFTKDKEPGVFFITASESNLEISVSNVIRYAHKRGLDLKLSATTQNLMERLNSRAALLLEKKRLLKKIKESRLENNSDFEDFSKFSSLNIKRKLKPHQLISSYHLYKALNGANFSVPGSGKTSVVLTVYQKLKSEGIVNTLFVIGPPSSFGSWINEFKQTLGYLPVTKILAGGNISTRKDEYYSKIDNKSELYLSTFQTVLNDQQEVSTFFKTEAIKIFLVVDEAHYIKQINGNWANAILNISKFAIRKCALTGTPLPKSYSDVFNLFDFLWPEQPLIDENTRGKILQLEQSGRNEQVKEILDETIGPFFFRVKKSDLGLTAPVFHPVIKIKMHPIERILYEAIENKIKNNSIDKYEDTEVAFRLRKGRMIRLRQAISYPKLLLKAIEGYDEQLYEADRTLVDYIRKYDDLETTAKTGKLLQLVNELISKKEKVIVWSNFVRTVEMLSDLLAKEGIKNKKIYGKTPFESHNPGTEESRESIRQEFLDINSGLNVLIANPAACAESISLHTTCHNAIYYDLSYNCSQYLQSLDRIHRVGGSEESVSNYYFLEYENTFEHDIKDNLEIKAQRMYDIIDQNYSIAPDESTDEEQAYERLFDS